MTLTVDLSGNMEARLRKASPEGRKRWEEAKKRDEKMREWMQRDNEDEAKKKQNDWEKLWGDATTMDEQEIPLPSEEKKVVKAPHAEKDWERELGELFCLLLVLGTVGHVISAAWKRLGVLALPLVAAFVVAWPTYILVITWLTVLGTVDTFGTIITVLVALWNIFELCCVWWHEQKRFGAVVEFKTGFFSIHSLFFVLPALNNSDAMVSVATVPFGFGMLGVAFCNILVICWHLATILLTRFVVPLLIFAVWRCAARMGAEREEARHGQDLRAES